MNLSQDDEDFGQVGYGDFDTNAQLPEQSQDDLDTGAVVHSKYDYIARKRLGLVAQEPSGSMLMGSEDLARNLQQQHSPPRSNFKQDVTRILQQINEHDAPPPPTFHHDDEHLLPGHGDYSPRVNIPIAAAIVNYSPAAAAAFSPRSRYAPSPSHAAAGHTPIDSPGGGRLTAASQATGIAPAAGRSRRQPATAAAPTLGGGAGGMVISAGGIEVDEELFHAFQVHKATSPPNTKKRDNRRNPQQQQQHGYPRRAVPPPSFNATLTTPGPNTAVNNNPLLSLLTKGNSSRGAAGGNGGGCGSGSGAGTPVTAQPSGHQPSRFRQPALGTPGGHTTTTAAAADGATAGPSRFQREQQQQQQQRNMATTNATTPGAPAGSAEFPEQQQQQQQEGQDIILSSEEEEDNQNPGDSTAAVAAGRNGDIDTPVNARTAAFGAAAAIGNIQTAVAGGSGVSGGGGSAQRLTGPQDSFLANLAPPSTRAPHGHVRSRLGGAGGASGSGPLQARLKRIRMADEHAAAAAAAANNATSNTLEAIIQDRGIENNCLKVRGVRHNSQNALESAYFVIGDKASASLSDLTLGRKMVVKRPWREVPPSDDGIRVFVCSGEVSAQSN